MELGVDLGNLSLKLGPLSHCTVIPETKQVEEKVKDIVIIVAVGWPNFGLQDYNEGK